MHRSRGLTPHHHALLRAFGAQAVWSGTRFRSMGYDVPSACPRCGAASDSLHHRLWERESTKQLRLDVFTDAEIQWLHSSPSRAILGLGLQRVPHIPDPLPVGLGCEEGQYRSWTIDGSPLSAHFHGVVFTDGSCIKPGARCWQRAAWAVVKINDEGELMAWASGRVGDQLPQTSPAAENVGTLASALLAAPLTKSMRDYKAMNHIEDQGLRWVGNHRAPYAGVRRQVRGRAKQGFHVRWCPGRVALEN